MSGHSLPPPLMNSEPGSFAEHTIAERLPRIVQGVIQHNHYPPEIVAQLQGLIQELRSGTVAPLQENASDVAAWREAWEPWQGRRWFDLEWFFSETYFYRRILEIVQYFQHGPWYLFDPFDVEKRLSLGPALKTLAAFYDSLAPDAPREKQFALWLQRSLWGNRADLSNVLARDKAHEQVQQIEADRLLVDDTPLLWQLIAEEHVRRIDWVADNSGLELLADLGLIDWLLSNDLAEQIYLHLKAQPYFVSDAMAKDLLVSLHALRLASAAPLQDLSARLSAAHQRGQLVVQDHPFWTTHLSFYDLPDDLRRELSASDLILFKGDANYRRLLGDRHWPSTADLSASAARLPAAWAVLRTLKSEVVAGLAQGLAERLDQEDPAWRINGERGVIHAITKTQART